MNDDVLHIADDGKVFSGGYVAIVEYYTFANEWSDRKHIKRFKNFETLDKFIKKNYPEKEQ